MKKYNIVTLLILLIFAFAGCNENEDKFSDAMDGADVGGAIPYVQFYTPRIFDVADLNQAKMAFNLDVGAVGEGKTYKSVIIEKVFNGGDTVVHAVVEADRIPMEISITIDEALNGTDANKAELKGGDYFDWIFKIEFADGKNGVYSEEALGVFPDFRSYLASAPDGFEVGGNYTSVLLVDETEAAFSSYDATAPYTVTNVPGTGNTQYILSDLLHGAGLNLYGVTVPQRLYYIGSNSFVFNSLPESYGTYFQAEGTVVIDPNSGVITVDAGINGLLGGATLKYELTPITAE